MEVLLEPFLRLTCPYIRFQEVSVTLGAWKKIYRLGAYLLGQSFHLFTFHESNRVEVFVLLPVEPVVDPGHLQLGADQALPSQGHVTVLVENGFAGGVWKSETRFFDRSLQLPQNAWA